MEINSKGYFSSERADGETFLQAKIHYRDWQEVDLTLQYDGLVLMGKERSLKKLEVQMLHVFLGDMENAVYNTAVFFKNDYEDEWIISPFVKEMIRDVDHSEVIDSGVIDSPVLGKIPPVGLSGGVKTLILVLFEPQRVFNASTCGDNCAKWLLKIAENEDRTVNLRHIMDFGKEEFQIYIDNTGTVVHTMKEFTEVAVDYV